MSKVKISVNYDAVGKLLKSDSLTEYTKQVANDLAMKCGDGYEVDQHAMPQRYVFGVAPVTREAMIDNENNNTLLNNVVR